MSFGSHHIDMLASWGLQTGLMVSLLIGLVLIIRRPFARYFGANAAYALWLLPLVRLFLPTMTVPFLTRAVPDEIITEVNYILPANIDVSDVASATITPSVPHVPTESFNVLALVAVLWLSLALLWFAYQLLKQRRFMAHMRAESLPISENFALAVSHSKEAVGLKNMPEIRLSDKVSGPMVTGVMKPLILLPKDFESRFTTDQQAFALIHEMAHIKRGDLWVAFIVLAYRALFWPNPLVHFAAHKLRVDQEAACDASVIAKTGPDSTHSYAETLVHAAKSVGRQSHNAPLGLALSDTPLKPETEK
jgi:beta-lactamase regulating signal transducer with metallopeptidase domain